MDELSLEELVLVNRLAERFETAWRRGRRPRIEAYLKNQTPRQDRVILEALLGIEIELRRAVGEHPRESEYTHRFLGHEQLLTAIFACSEEHSEVDANDDEAEIRP